MARKMLSMGQTFELGQWLKDSEAKLMSMSRNEIAQAATRELGFKVSYSSIKNLTDELGIKTLARPGGSGTKRVTMRRFQVLVNELRMLLQDLEVEQSPEFIELVADIFNHDQEEEE